MAVANYNRINLIQAEQAASLRLNTASTGFSNLDDNSVKGEFYLSTNTNTFKTIHIVLAGDIALDSEFILPDGWIISLKMTGGKQHIWIHNLLKTPLPSNNVLFLYNGNIARLLACKVYGYNAGTVLANVAHFGNNEKSCNVDDASVESNIMKLEDNAEGTSRTGKSTGRESLRYLAGNNDRVGLVGNRSRTGHRGSQETKKYNPKEAFDRQEVDQSKRRFRYYPNGQLIKLGLPPSYRRADKEITDEWLQKNKTNHRFLYENPDSNITRGTNPGAVVPYAQPDACVNCGYRLNSFCEKWKELIRFNYWCESFRKYSGHKELVKREINKQLEADQGELK